MLTSLQNPLVKQIRQLHSHKGRREQGLLLLEGTHLLREACATQYPLLTVCSTFQWQASHVELWQEACLKAQRVELVSESVLEALVTTVQPDGVVAVAPSREQSSLKILSDGLLLALDAIQDPGNLGTIIRTAAAAGAGGLWLSRDSVDYTSPKVMRASAGQWFRLPIAVTDDIYQLVADYQDRGMQVVATRPHTELSYWEVNWKRPSLVLLGNEGAGLPKELSDRADCQVKIPLANGVESLNVGISAALILYEAQRQLLSQKTENSRF
ncbi:rRNA methyltransferase [Merismopedia glauca CCAP 1448/3]|uniref:rRNA methyltransferase n=1 Tax=Merismopedia glauca CCAP 1448/3 TaxID=1296344 RepID=A0A2T1BWY9_9CYAN|nr:RNA methyltransferase [Merismopedia glauca]PSB00520.1 rRNA methyltransferase [Merismopedia glauca CCAP 1448/3]